MANNFGRVNVSVTASTGGLTAGLANASKQVAGFSRNVSGMTGGMGAMNAAASETSVLFSDIGGLLGTVALGFKNGALASKLFAGSIQLLTVTMKAILIPLGIVASIIGIFRGFSDAASRLDEASKSATRFGMATSTFQALAQVADESGVSASQAAGLFTIMGRQIGNLQAGSASAEKAFGRLGLTFSQLQGLSPEQQFQLIAQRIAALPTAAERAAAATAIFGRSGAASMNFITAAAGGATAEMMKLQSALGVSMTDQQVKGVEMMNDAWGRLGMITEGFWNQLVAGVAPAITVLSNLILKFFAENATGWQIANAFATVFAGTLRVVVGAFTVMYGFMQLVTAAFAGIQSVSFMVWQGITAGISAVIGAIASLLEAIPGIDAGLIQSLRTAEKFTSQLSEAFGQESAVWGQASSDLWSQGTENIANPYGAFDSEMAKVQADMAKAGTVGGQAFSETASNGIAAAVKASSQSLKALVVGSSEAESYMNRLKMGFDPRDAGDAEDRTADATERTADGVEDLAGQFAEMNLGLATIQV